ncbi:phosphocarrier protein HPr [Oleiphilus sp. HI0071]|uniref:HPr family phosphocarrier protein n=1 Tax=unclassified Oleiphilus TaxID=2631174 RepID=UPI0007C32466|nr:MULTISPECIES: HPr family phosphocarrier protein [unclassified Oleiphilus]KZY59178.1 phosphocarrier protein HPr [Oleiphilus sp. HI0065]KZY80088.1 phosphocarrier protein HPr [Oleiphilus sp. HI0071]KZY96648.1 phosphocarrier protein HPr [Oleiphilus sp. HI0073]KZZ40863.1 phosphocarrier protein HPr [Oleiphilus sp. HI0118]KZZ50842.1 phosphocarrier protein HPr [Oleiphilus sp. HI0122]KZZ65816.1 phosphocarrier protein HPr [Oleiphilus sp. HI0130]KZZ74172.1 phosphocarrier protein HPr [Oleiphilus sp. 
MLCETVEIINDLGLHARAAAKFVECTCHFESSFLISKDGREVDGKSIMSVMMLAASKGTEISIQVEGPDETKALAALKALISNKFGEES